jgi:uncharacterized protein
MSIKTIASLVAAAALSAGISLPAAARAVTDCPLRDAPFSIDSPLIDILLSPAAKAVLEKAVPGRFSKLPPRFAGTTPPTFAAILTLREGGAISGIKPEAMPAIDAELRTGHRGRQGGALRAL